MVGSLSHIELELAPCPQHRFGERGRVYHLYLPLRVDDRLNLDALRAAGASGHVRRCRPAEDEVAGRVTLEPDGRLAFSFDGRPSNRAQGFSSPPDRFVVGRTVHIFEEDGECWPFQVIAIRHPAGGQSRRDKLTA